MEKVISIENLKEFGLLGVGYTELDLYDAFLMYLILNKNQDNDYVVLRDGDILFDSRTCFGMNTWMV